MALMYVKMTSKMRDGYVDDIVDNIPACEYDGEYCILNTDTGEWIPIHFDHASDIIRMYWENKFNIPLHGKLLRRIKNRIKSKVYALGWVLVKPPVC